MFPFPLSDDGLDQRLRDVPVPEGLVDRLQQTVRWTDVEVDDAVAEVPLPPGLISRLTRIAPRNPRERNLRRLALAASLLLAVGLSYAGAWAIYATSGYWTAQQSSPEGLDALESTQITGSAAVEPFIDPRIAEQLVDEPEHVAAQSPEIELAVVERVPPIPVFPSPFPLLERIRPNAGRMAELGLEHFGAEVLGAAQVEAELPEWRLLPGLVPRGMEPPKSPGFDLAFLHATRFHPVVMPAFDKELTTSRVPLSASRESFLLAGRSLSEGELPPPEMIRTEEFLAAVDYAYPAPVRDRLALHTAAGLSPLGGSQLRLLQVGVRAADVEVPQRGPAHLIVCVDVSSSMQRGARLEQAQQALREIVPRLSSQDRVSLVAFGKDARVLIEMAGPSHATELLAAVDALRFEAGSNPVAALRLAYGLASEDAVVPGRTQQVLLFTDGLIEVDPLATRSLEAYLRTSAGRSARLWLVDLSSSQVTPPHWLQLAQASDGRLEQAATADQMRWTLCEALTGKSQKVAAGATLSVWFNPQAVAGYRLFGHEATLLAAEPHADLFAGQTSVGLYELQLLPKPADHVATVTLAWRDAATGQPRTLAQRITRGSFAKSFSSEPASLQLATLAAEAAELLRRSPYREAGTFRLLRELAGEASGSTVENASYSELVSLLRQAERARPASTRQRQMWNRAK